MNVKPLFAKVCLAVCAPVLFLLFAEIVLRILGVGYPASFLLSDHLHGRDAWVNNSYYGYRFFKPQAARNPAPTVINKSKESDTIRIAVLGESAAMGDPAIEFSLARALDKILNPPGTPRRFELINAAMTAINSPVIVDIAADVARADIDVFVIYMGNNEVVGPYGPGTAITSGDWGNRLTPLRVRLSRLRLAGLLNQLSGALTRNNATAQAWTGMEMFDRNRIAHDDPRLDSMNRRFRENLERIIALADRKGIRVVLCTMAVNLSDHAPFGSTNRIDIGSARLREWNNLFREGRISQNEGELDKARQAFEQARDLDDQHAELIYRLGIIYQSLELTEEASRHFALARDLDTQRFRTDSRLNHVIRDVAAEHHDVAFADIEAAFAMADDRETFVDHVHFSLDGLYLLSREVRQALTKWFELPDLPTKEALLKAMMQTPWSERKIATSMLTRRERPPFSTQWGNHEQMDRLRHQAEAAAAVIATTAVEQVIAAHDTYYPMYPHDFYYSAQLGYILCVEERWEAAASLLKTGTDSLRGFSDIHSLSALAQAMNGDPESAAQVLLRTGPPYGYFITESAHMIIESYKRKDRTSEAGRFARAMLAKGIRFPDHEIIARHTKP